MEHNLTLSMLYYICGCFYMIFGAYTIVANAKSNVNRLFVITTSSMAIWSFAYAISNSAPTAEASAFWNSFSTFGWGVFYSLFLHFVLILTETESRLNKRTIFAMIYLPALINIILFAPFGFLAETQYKMVQTDFGWINTVPVDIWGIWFIVYYAVFSIVSILLLFRWWSKFEPRTPLKRQITYFLISILLPFFLGIATETLPTLFGNSFFPKLAIIFMMIPVTTLFFALKNFGMLLEKKEETIIFLETERLQTGDRLRLFQTATAVFVIGAAISFLIGHFSMKGALNYELFLAALLLFIGLLTRLIPLLTKNHTIQNTIFLAICTVGMLFFMITNAETGAITIWSVYILFLLFTVILDSKVHAYIFVVINVIMQIVFGKLYPKVIVTINGSEYLTRIFIIVLSFIAVRYVTSEYTSKMLGYQRFAKGQKVLEKISTNFISINTENARKKIDEMFEMSAEILDFDHAYLVGFDTDYKEATFLNIYIKDITAESLPYHPKMKVKTVTLPLVRPLIVQKQPIVCENLTDVPFNEDIEIRDFFMSRGIHSFFALPITANEEIAGMLVVEYFDRSDIANRESRLYFLKIIANILGDAKKKTLYEERLYNVAYFDEITKLANKNMLIQRLKQHMENRKESEKIAILNIELENLRTIKDTFGHHVGEQITIKSATILKTLLGENCDISRSAEGAFVVVIPAVENAEQVESCANRIIDSFSSPVLTERGTEALFVIVNIGISVYPDNGRDAYTLLKNADLAGFQAKSTNNKILYYTEQLEDYIAKNTLFTNRLFNSLQNEEFSLEFQPQVRCDTGKTVGIEALLRWTTDGQRRVPPDRFIPILEQTGLIYDVGLWVLKQALQEHNRLVEKGFSPLRVSVNLSVVQFQNKDFVSDVSKIIKESKVDPKYIELEITESLFSKNLAEVIQKLHQLKELGVRVAIDDFGREYSSLNRLKLVPFDRIKIDKDIIDYIDLKRKKAPITKSIILLAKAFSADITAEGVETKEQADFLRSLDCDEIQGYYFSRPLSPEALEKFLKKQ